MPPTASQLDLGIGTRRAPPLDATNARSLRSLAALLVVRPRGRTAVGRSHFARNVAEIKEAARPSLNSAALLVVRPRGRTAVDATDGEPARSRHRYSPRAPAGRHQRQKPTEPCSVARRAPTWAHRGRTESLREERCRDQRGRAAQLEFGSVARRAPTWAHRGRCHRRRASSISASVLAARPRWTPPTPEAYGALQRCSSCAHVGAPRSDGVTSRGTLPRSKRPRGPA